MKERWQLRRAYTLKPGMVIFFEGQELALSAVRVDELVYVAYPSKYGSLGQGFFLQKDKYIPVKLAEPPVLPEPPRTLTIADHAKRNLRPGRTVLGAPPLAPEPPPLRYERDPHGFGSWWDNLKDWLNGR